VVVRLGPSLWRLERSAVFESRFAHDSQGEPVRAGRDPRDQHPTDPSPTTPKPQCFQALLSDAEGGASPTAHENRRTFGPLQGSRRARRGGFRPPRDRVAHPGHGYIR